VILFVVEVMGCAVAIVPEVQSSTLGTVHRKIAGQKSGYWLH